MVDSSNINPGRERERESQHGDTEGNRSLDSYAFSPNPIISSPEEAANLFLPLLLTGMSFPLLRPLLNHHRLQKGFFLYIFPSVVFVALAVLLSCTTERYFQREEEEVTHLKNKGKE